MEKKVVKPIRPEDIKIEKTIPWYIVESVNELIQKNYRHDTGSFTIKQKEILKLAYDKSGEEDYHTFSNKVFECHQLDFEDLYREAGWKVEYDKPAYCETYEPFFRFKRK